MQKHSGAHYFKHKIINELLENNQVLRGNEQVSGVKFQKVYYEILKWVTSP